MSELASGRAFGWFERLTQITQQPLDVVSLDDAEEWSKDHDERSQREAPAAAGTLFNVNLERSAHQFGVRAIH